MASFKEIQARRISILAYMSFGTMGTEKIAELLQVDRKTIYNDVKSMEKIKLVIPGKKRGVARYELTKLGELSLESETIEII